MLQVMLDLETMSTKSNAAIVSIGAVMFSKDDGIVDKFYRTVDLRTSKAAGLHIDPETVKWWGQQSEEAQKALTIDNVSLNQALDDFTEWYGKEKIPVWGNGSTFDNVILSHAYDSLNLTKPWPWYLDYCYRTMKNIYKKVEADKREGVHHNALDDAIFQANHLIKIMRQI